MNLPKKIATFFKTRSPIIDNSLKLVRFLLGIGIAYTLIHLLIRSTNTSVWEEMVHARRSLMLISIVWFSGSLYLVVERLYLLLRIQGIHLSRWYITKVSMISNFLSIVIPGAVSGDLIKMMYVAKQTEKKKAEALLTIFLDRVIGMVGLMVITAMVILLYLPRIIVLGAAHSYIQMAIITVGIGSVLCILIFFLLLLQAHRTNSAGGKFYNWLHDRMPQKIIPMVDRLTAAFNLYRNNLTVIFKTLLLSIVNHIWLGANLFLIGRSVGEHIMHFGDYILATQVSNLIAVFPITPGGFGVRDAGTALLFQFLGAQMEKAGVIPVIMTLIFILWRLIGGWFFIFSKFSKISAEDRSLPSKSNNLIREQS